VLESVSFAYTGQAAPTLQDVTLLAASGEMLGLIGPNGAGKSTLLKLASGVLRPTTGAIRLHGADLRSLRRPEVARQVAVVPQDFSVQFAYTVRQIVELGRIPHTGIWGLLQPDDNAAVQRALEATQTVELADRVYNDLSGGERQRVLLALALAQDADVLLLDEPTAHLDIKHQIEILELLSTLNRDCGLTVVAVLHDLNLAARYFSRLVLFRYSVVADGPPAAVLDAGLLSRVYATPVQVGILRGEEHISVLPPAKAAASSRTDPNGVAASPAVHVLAGGGSGELLMRALSDAGIAFSAGPLNAGDSDYELARRLAALCLTEPPFAPVSSSGLAAAREHMLGASAVIVCPMPLGPGNVALLDAALDAARTSVPVLLLEPEASLIASDDMDGAADNAAQALARAVATRDFSGRGPQLYAALIQAGAHIATSPAQVGARLREHAQRHEA
jgi:iron complex transport system ATP-binding protein